MRRWRNSASPLLSMALPNKWFIKIGLVDFEIYEVGILHQYIQMTEITRSYVWVRTHDFVREITPDRSLSS